MANNPETKSRTLNDFRGRMLGGGARPNLFECEIFFPASSLPEDVKAVDLSDATRFLIKAAALPASTLGIIDVPFRGRNLKIAGDRTFDPWTITVINERDFNIRTAFERWMNLINKHEDNAGLINPIDYQQNAIVKQLGRAGLSGPNGDGKGPTSDKELPVLKQYKFYGIFPTAISDIALSYDSSDTIEEFTVDLQVQWWDALNAKGDTQLGTGS